VLVVLSNSGSINNPTISPIYQSPAVGMTGNDFLNAVVGGITSEPVNDVQETLRKIEGDAGRVRTANKFVDRTLDLDLLLYGNTIQTDDKKGTTLPHPEILEQAYVLKPLADIAGDLVHPTEAKTMSALLQRLKAESPEIFSPLQQVTLIPQ